MCGLQTLLIAHSAACRSSVLACSSSLHWTHDVLTYDSSSPPPQEFDLRVDIESLGVGPQGEESVMPTELSYDAFRVLLS